MLEETKKPFLWDFKKNSQLQAERGISFRTAVRAIRDGKILNVIEHSDKAKYPLRQIFILEVDQYVYLVPFIESSENIYLETIIPNMKMRKKYYGA